MIKVKWGVGGVKEEQKGKIMNPKFSRFGEGDH